MLRIKMIQGHLGTFCTYRYGNGDPIYIINGGPGLEYQYLYKWLLPLNDIGELVFYDQYGTGKDYGLHRNITADALVKQLNDLLIDDKREKDVIAHSWGSYLLLSLFLEKSNYNIRKLVLMNPFALNYQRYVSTGQRLVERFPKYIVKEINRLESQGTQEAYLQLMELSTPYYVHDYKNPPVIQYGSYDGKMGDCVYSSIVGFDHTNVPTHIANEMLVIKSDDDFITFDDTIELQNCSKRVEIFSMCGHYSFAEKNVKCLELIEEFLNREKS